MPFRKGAEGCMATKRVAVRMMRAAQVAKAGGDFELVERDIPEPGPGQVRVKVEACGICHSDVMVKDGLWPGLHILVCRVTKSPAAWMLSAREFRPYARGIASGWGGTVAMISCAITVGAAISPCVSNAR